MKTLWLIGLPIWAFANFALAGWMIDRLQRRIRWWSFPVWMTFWVCWLPIVIAGVLFFSFQAFD